MLTQTLVFGDVVDSAIMQAEVGATLRGEKSHAVRATWGMDPDEYTRFVRERHAERATAREGLPC